MIESKEKTKALKRKRKHRGKVAKIGYERAQMVNKVIVPLYIFILYSLSSKIISWSHPSVNKSKNGRAN